MNCEDFQKRLLQDPFCTDAEFLQHKEHCVSCEEEWKRAQSFEQMLHNVVMQPSSTPGEIRLHAPQRRLWQRTWMKMASVLLLLAASLGGYNLLRHLFSPASLADVVTHHIQAEPDFLRHTETLDELSVATLFASMGFELRTSLKGVTAALPCWIRKGRGVHMVLRGEQGAVSLLLMPGEYLDERQELQAEDWSGALIPEPWGSLAVLVSAGEDTDAVVYLVERNLRWKGKPASRRF